MNLLPSIGGMVAGLVAAGIYFAAANPPPTPPPTLAKQIASLPSTPYDGETVRLEERVAQVGSQPFIKIAYYQFGHAGYVTRFKIMVDGTVRSWSDDVDRGIHIADGYQPQLPGSRITPGDVAMLPLQYNPNDSAFRQHSLRHAQVLTILDRQGRPAIVAHLDGRGLLADLVYYLHGRIASRVTLLDWRVVPNKPALWYSGGH